MPVLAVDTASPAPALALEPEPGEVGNGAGFLESLAANAAEALPGRLAALLDRAGSDRTGLEMIAVISGPGSFTGLRAGIAFARGLARALRVPLVTVPTFDAASVALPEPAGVAFVLDAGRGEVHLAERRTGSLLAPEGPLPRADAFSRMLALGVPVRDLDNEPLSLAQAAARIAWSGRAGSGEAASVSYGRRSAAEEKFDPEGVEIR